jgi:hypothetical protein
MRFVEVAYRRDGLPSGVPLQPGLTVVQGLIGPARREWIERVLGGLLGTRSGDGVTLVLVDSAGNRIRLERDESGAATVTDDATGQELAYSAAHLPLDGRFDWFASLGIKPDAARALLVLEASALEGDESFDHYDSEADLDQARRALSELEAEYQAVVGRQDHVRELRQRAAALDEEVRRQEEQWARWRHAQAGAAVRRLETELAVLNGFEPPEKVAAEAVLAAVGAGDRWRRAGAAVEQARAAFGDRSRLDPDTLERALRLPAEVPTGLDSLQASYLSAARCRTELLARIDESGTQPAPVLPPGLFLLRPDHPEFWERAERVRATRIQATAMSVSLGGIGRRGELIQELEAAHEAVEEAESELGAVRLPALAIAVRRRLTRARQHELAVLTRAGFVSWFSFQMRRITVHVERDAVEALRSAELELELAELVWSELAGDVDVEVALGARGEIEGYVAAVAAAEEALTALRRQLSDEVEPAYAEARRALLDACRLFDVDPEHAVAQVSESVARAGHARLQRALEDADATHLDAEAQLEWHLAGIGLAGGPDDRAGRLEELTVRTAEAAGYLETAVTARPAEVVVAELSRARSELISLHRPGFDGGPVERPLSEVDALAHDRDRLVEEAVATERGLPDVDRLGDRRETLERRVAVLEAAGRAGYWPLDFDEAEMVLFDRITWARRDGEESIPVLVDDALVAFAGHDKACLLDLVARLSEGTQIVYLTDDEETVEWARVAAGEGQPVVVL